VAVYEGARPRTTVLPRRLDGPLLRPGVRLVPGRPARVGQRARKRPRLFAVAIGAIAVAFLLSFFSLVQTVRVSTSSWDMAQLTNEYSQLQVQRQQDLSDVERLSRESAIRRKAIDNGLTQLAAPSIIPAR
jgi:hypothetical protein